MLFEMQEDHEGTAGGKLAVALLEVNACALKLYMRTTSLGDDGHDVAASATSQVCGRVTVSISQSPEPTQAALENLG